MGIYFHMVVKAIVTIYVLYKLWYWLFRGGAMKYWQRIPVRPPKAKPGKAVQAASAGKAEAVVGRTKVVYLEDPKAGPSAVASEDLEPTGFIGQDEDISADDVETDYRPRESAPVPGIEELYDEPDGYPAGDEISSGMSFEQIGEAVSVLTKQVIDEDKKGRAAQTLYDLQNMDIFDFITSEVSNAIAVENLLKDYLDSNGEPKSKSENILTEEIINGFDIDLYV